MKTTWDAGLAHQIMNLQQSAIALCSEHPPLTANQACELFGTRYPSTRGGYPTGCDDQAFLAMFEASSPPAHLVVDKQCNRCGTTGYFARISEFAAPLVGLITETCRQDRLLPYSCCAGLQLTD